MRPVAGYRLCRRRLLGSGVPAIGVAAALAGCGRDSGPADPPAGQAAPAARVRILTRTEYDAAAWTAFDESAPDVQVELETGPNLTKDFGDKILALAAADSAPDVI